MNSGLRNCKKNNPTSILSGAVSDDGEQAQLVLGSLKLLSWPPTFAYWGYTSHSFWGFFFAFILPDLSRGRLNFVFNWFCILAIHYHTADAK